MKKSKKLTSVDREKMWGENGPYSQVRMCEETRILDDSVSRVFLVIEAEINPFTFEYAKSHRNKFKNDERVLQLLDYAEYQGDRGYVVEAGEVKLDNNDSRLFARKQADTTIEVLIKMHRFVMDEFGFDKKKGFGVIEDTVPGDELFVWNEKTGRVEELGISLFDSKTFVGSESGVKNNKMRFFIVLAFKRGFDFKEETVIHFAKTLKKISMSFKVEIEDVESFSKHVLIKALIPFDVAPADFIEEVIDKTNIKPNKLVFLKDYIITNTHAPTPEEIMKFLGGTKNS